MKAQQRAGCFLAGLILLLCTPFSAQAHRVNIFCWTDSGRISCEASFPDGSPVSGGSILVRSKQTGERLLEARTGEQGQISFSVPDQAVQNGWDLEVLLDASMGHQASWIVRADELGLKEPADSEAAGTAASGERGAEPSDTAQQQAREAHQPQLDKEQLEAIVSRAVSREMVPVKKQIQSLKQERVSIQDVLGGLGYILGLMGLALYFKSRRAARE